MSTSGWQQFGITYSILCRIGRNLDANSFASFLSAQRSLHYCARRVNKWRIARRKRGGRSFGWKQVLKATSVAATCASCIYIGGPIRHHVTDASRLLCTVAWDRAGWVFWERLCLPQLPWPPLSTLLLLRSSLFNRSGPFLHAATCSKTRRVHISPAIPSAACSPKYANMLTVRLDPQADDFSCRA